MPEGRLIELTFAYGRSQILYAGVIQGRDTGR
jgi:hypothetical protein